MIGRRPRNPKIGDRAEYLGTFLLSWIAQAISVPRQEDYGVDFRGALLWEDGKSLRVGRRFAVQFKSNKTAFFQPVGKPIRRGKTQEWDQARVRCLLGRTPYVVDPAPLFLGHVDVKRGRLSLYSTAPMWNARWLGFPTEVLLDPKRWPAAPSGLDAGKAPFDIVPLATAYPKGHPPPPSTLGRVVVPIGPPVVQLDVASAGKSNAAALRERVVRCLDEWIQVDTLNRFAATLEVPVCFWHAGWTVNEAPRQEHRESNSYANPSPAHGLSAGDVERSLRPFVQAWDRVRVAQGQPSLLGEAFHQNSMLAFVQSDPVARAVAVDGLRKSHPNAKAVLAP